MLSDKDGVFMPHLFSYDEGYYDVYDNLEYDSGRYYSDNEYANGVDEAWLD